MSTRIDRRRFLTAAGIGAAALGGNLLRTPWNRGPLALPRAHAQGMPPRFLFLYTDGGWTPRGMFMRPAFAPDSWTHWSEILKQQVHVVDPTLPEPSAFEFSFTDPALSRSDMSRVLDPYWDLRSRLLFFESLTMLSRTGDSFGDGHAQNNAAATTAHRSGGPGDAFTSAPGGASIDQLFLQHVRATDPLAYCLSVTPDVLRRTGAWWAHYPWISANAHGGFDRVPMEGDPARVAERLFGAADADTTDAERRAMARSAMFASLDARYRDLASRTGGYDRTRLESHRGLLAEIAATVARAPLSCDGVEVGSTEGLDQVAAYENDFRAFTDIITASFACGATRVATMALSIPPPAYGLAAGTNIHHDYEHASDPTAFYGPTGGNAAAEDRMIQRHIYTAQRVQQIVRRLDETPDADGASLLDSTIVLFASELAHGLHGSEYCPFLVFGGDALGIQSGRYVKHPYDVATHRRGYTNRWTGRPHTQLYVSLLQALGMDIDFIDRRRIASDMQIPHSNDWETYQVKIDGTLPGVTSPLPAVLPSPHD